MLNQLVNSLSQTQKTGRMKNKRITPIFVPESPIFDYKKMILVGIFSCLVYGVLRDNQTPKFPNKKPIGFMVKNKGYFLRLSYQGLSYFFHIIIHRCVNITQFFNAFNRMHNRCVVTPPKGTPNGRQ